ncbi:MAG: hypothetical protein AAFU79_03000, partial [Myxococcota bacterium]
MCGSLPRLGLVLALVGCDASPRVVGLTPHAEKVPANTLRWRLRFSEPMRRGFARRFVSLETSDGGRLNALYLGAQELWDPTGQVLTLYLHPGRLKTGLRLRSVEGPPFEVDGHYRLVVRPGWPTARGPRLAQLFSHPFEVIRAERRAVNPRAWRVELTREHLTVSFPRLMDPASVAASLRLESSQGGSPRLVEVGTESCRFELGGAPHDAVRLVVLPNLEDIAGNRIQASFERPVGPAKSNHTMVQGHMRPPRYPRGHET